MKSNDMVVDVNHWSWDYLADLMTDYCMGEKNKTEKYFSDYWINFNEYLQSSGIEYIDYNSKKTYFNTLKFKNMLNIYKKTAYLYMNTNTFGQMMNSGMLFSENFLFLFNPRETHKRHSIIQYYTGGKVRMIPYPTYNGQNELTAKPFDMAAINSKSKNKKMAYELIKILLSDNIQKSEGLDGAPVSKSTFFSMLEEFSKDAANAKWGDINTYKLNEKLIEDIKSIVDGIKRCIIMDKDVLTIINAISNDYATGKYNMQEAIEKMENEVTLYLNE